MDYNFLTSGRSRKNRQMLNDMRVRAEFDKQEKLKLEKEEAERKKNERMNSGDFLYPKPIDKKFGKKSFLTPLMKKNVIPAHPCSVSFLGGSGSGKTTCLIYMLNNFYENFFDEIHLFAITGRSDSSFEALNLPKNRIYTENLEDKLEELISKRKKLVESKGFNKTKPILVILEDISSSYKFLRSSVMTLAFTALRHINASLFAVSHKYRSLPPVCRLNAHNHLIFPCPMSDRLVIADDHCPSSLTKKEFLELMATAFKKCDKLQRPFLYINNQVSPKTRFRRGFATILQLNE